MPQLLLPPSRVRLWWGLAIAVVAPLLVTPVIALPALRDYPSMYYILIIAVAAAVGRLLAGGVAVVVSSALFGFEFLSPQRSFVLDPGSVEVFIGFCIIAVALAQLIVSADAARTRAEATMARVDLASRVSAALGSSIDYDETMQAVGRVLIPDLADWFSVHVLDERTGAVINAHVDHLDPDRVAFAKDLWRRLPPPSLDDPQGVGHVIRTRQPELTPEVTDEMIVTALEPIYPDLVPAFLELQLRSVMVVPMIAGDRVIGALQLVSAESGRHYTDEDLALAQEVASRAAVAIENAALYRKRVEEVRALQQRLLPRSLPSIPGVEVAARYLPAQEDMVVGGDFYDLFEMNDGNWKAVIGDVSGKGVDAAALMGFVRFTMRAVSRDDTRPSDALRKLNGAFRDEIGDETTFCTAAVTRIHPHDGGARLTIAVAGHPLPYAIRADGTVEPAGRTGALLGFLDEIDVTDSVLDLHPGDSLLLLTDGVLECSRDPDWSDVTIPELLSLTAGMRPTTLVDLVEGTVAQVEDRRADDIALLALHLPVSAASSPRSDVPRALVVDDELRLVDGNATALADLGYSREELPALSARDLVIEPANLDAERERFAEEGRWSGTVTLRRRDGMPVTYGVATSSLRTSERVIHLARLTPEPVSTSS
ncbi:MAG TPA: SpoIIE family protein phosphatase [Actinomycetota bacterium]|nr:SpoIIE family protein phosphatase [Actinomycetota bacterium]